MTPERRLLLLKTVEFLQYNCVKINPFTGKYEAGRKFKITNKESIEDYLNYIYSLPVDYARKYHPGIQVLDDWSEFKITNLPSEINSIRS